MDGCLLLNHVRSTELIWMKCDTVLDYRLDAVLAIGYFFSRKNVRFPWDNNYVNFDANEVAGKG